MLQALLYTPPRAAGCVRFYRIEVVDNLFGEYSVLREWGAPGSAGRHRVNLFSNLRDACVAADQWMFKANQRGFDLHSRI